MLRSRSTISCVILIYIILSLLPLTIAQVSDEVDVPWYPTPKIDGRIEPNEYPPPAVNITWSGTTSCKLYFCQNSSYLFIAIDIPDDTNQSNDKITIWLGIEPPSPERAPRLDDYKIVVTRDMKWYVDKLKMVNASTADSSGWRVEIAISFSELEIEKDSSKAMAIFIEDNGIVNARWPENAQEGNPKTWGKLSSTYSWGTIELVLLTPMINPMDPIAGQNLTINIEYGNDGTSPVENVTIGVYLDGSPIKIFSDIRRVESHGYFGISIPWKATYGNHTIAVKLDPFNRIFERNENNNNATINICVRLAKLKVKAPQGVNITFGELTKKVGSEKEVTFDTSLGRHNLIAQNTLYEGDTRYVFRRWSGGENSSTIVLTITKDLEIEAFYKKEYRLRMIFRDSKGSRRVQPNQVMISASNGSMITLNDTYDVWLQEGIVIISNIIWSGINVKPDNTTYHIQSPRNLTIYCRIYDVTVYVRDVFDFPIQGANATLLLPNQTSIWRTTDNEGKATFIGIPVGKIHGSVSNLGVTTLINEVDITSDYTISISMPLSVNTILIIIITCAGIISSILIIWMKRGTKRQRVPEPLRSLGPPI
jgi:hypothetical protein